MLCRKDILTTNGTLFLPNPYYKAGIDDFPYSHYETYLLQFQVLCAEQRNRVSSILWESFSIADRYFSAANDVLNV